MAYLIHRHGTFWFQIRVPKSLVSRYGTHIRQNLGLTERALAQPLAYQLASQWLTRFAFEKTDADAQGGVVPPPVPQSATPRCPVRLDGQAATARGTPAATTKAKCAEQHRTRRLV